MNLFGSRKPAPKKVDSEKILGNVREIQQSLDTLEKREKHLESKIVEQDKLAKDKLRAKDKRGALFCLKRKKMYEGEVNKLQGARTTLEQQKITLEGALTNLGIFDVMRKTARTMQEAHSQLDVDKVDDVMDEINEQMSLAQEVSNAISQPIGGQMFDEDELMGELDALESEMADEDLLAAPAVPSAPAVAAPSAPALPTAPSTAVAPRAPVAVAASAEEDELAALAASMAM